VNLQLETNKMLRRQLRQFKKARKNELFEDRMDGMVLRQQVEQESLSRARADTERREKVAQLAR
jgi:hypothetical protein